MPELSDLLALGIDYAVVACPTGLHEQIGLELAANGVSALIEKPLAPSVEAAAPTGRGLRVDLPVAGVTVTTELLQA